MLALNLVLNSSVLKHNKHGLALVPITSFCSLLWGYLDIGPISLFTLHDWHGAERRAMIALHFLYNSPVIKHNRHGLALVPTTSFCTLLWGRHGSEGKAMLASNFVYNSPVLNHNRHGFALVPTNSFLQILIITPPSLSTIDTALR